MATNFKKQIYANNATSALAFPVDQVTTVLSLADGSSFPQPLENEYFTLTLGYGSNVEIVEVYQRTGNSLTGCVRGAQGTVAQAFAAGTLAENRLTAESIGVFTREQDRLAPLDSILDLTRPEDLNGNSCLLYDTDDAGNPILAIEYSGRWRFATHPILLVDQEIYEPGAQVTPTSMEYSSSTDLSSIFTTRGLIVQAISGPNRGLSRFVTSATSSAVSWVNPFPNTFLYGDRIQVYQSASSALAWLTSQIAAVSGGQSSQQSLIQEEIYKTAYKSPVLVATTANISLSGLQTIDGVSITSGDRVLVKNQTTASQNGVYVASTSGWSRAVDANDGVKVRANMMVPVSSGSSSADSVWILDVVGPVSLGITDLPFKNINVLYATLASPSLTGTPTAPTAAVGTNTSQIATTAYVIGQASATAPAMNGTAAVGTSTRWARSDHVHPSDTSKASSASPAFTGTPTAPTAAVDTNTTQIATTAYVIGQAASSAPNMNGAASVGTSTRWARADHVHPSDITRAPLASPAFTGTPTAPTAVSTDTSTKLATTAFVKSVVSSLPTGVTSVAGKTGDVTLVVADVSGAAPLASPSLTGTPTAPTAAFATQTNQLATTRFVRDNSGNFASSTIGITASRSMLSAEAGTHSYIASTSDITITLPSIPEISNLVGYGAVFAFTNFSISATATFNVASDGYISAGAFNPTSTFRLSPGESVLFVNNAGSWIVYSGDGLLKYATSFSSVLGSQGYQKLPSGLILQWGTVINNATAGNPTAVTFPIAFPTAALQVLNTVNSAATTVQSAGSDTLSVTGFNSRSNAANVESRYLAIGK